MHTTRAIPQQRTSQKAITPSRALSETRGKHGSGLESADQQCLLLSCTLDVSPNHCPLGDGPLTQESETLLRLWTLSVRPRRATYGIIPPGHDWKYSVPDRWTPTTPTKNLPPRIPNNAGTHHSYPRTHTTNADEDTAPNPFRTARLPRTLYLFADASSRYSR